MKTEKAKHVVIRDLVIVLAFTAVSGIFFFLFQVYDRLYKLTEFLGGWHAGEFLLTMLTLITGIGWVSWRRSKALRREIIKHEEAEVLLKQSSGKLSAMLQSMGDLMCMIDKDFNVLWANEIAKNRFGDDIIGRKCYKAYYKREKPCEPYPCPTIKAFQDGGIHECDKQAIGKKGEKIDLHCTSNVVLKDKSEAPTAVMEICRDMTEQKETQKVLEKAHISLRKARDQLIQAEKLSALGKLASGVAHEVRNPLAVMVQGVNYLEKKIPANDKDIQGTLATIKSSVKRADSIVNSLLDFSKATKLNLHAMDINLILENCLVLVENKAKFQNIDITKELKRNIPKVLVDKNRIEQVFINVLLNAIQALPEKPEKKGKLIMRSYNKRLKEITSGVGRRREDSFRVGEEAVVVEIEDTGVGISEENLEKIFDPFFTTKDLTIGAGLGLSVSQSILSMHKALVDIRSQLGKGTTVTITLKIAKEG